MVQSPSKVLGSEARVMESFDQEGRGWNNITLLREIFNMEDQAAIQSVPISCTGQPDQLVWHGTRKGVFSVSSAYHMLKEQENGTQPENSSGGGHNAIWKGIWKMKSTNGVKNFMWRACKNLLPTKDNLLRKRVIEDPFCPICNLEAETTLHALWDCTASRGCMGGELSVPTEVFFQWCRFSSPYWRAVRKGGGR